MSYQFSLHEYISALKEFCQEGGSEVHENQFYKLITEWMKDGALRHSSMRLEKGPFIQKRHCAIALSYQTHYGWSLPIPSP